VGIEGQDAMSKAKVFVMAAALATMISCGATEPSSISYTDIFTGTVEMGGTSYGQGNRNHFTIHQAGNITVTITKLSPVSTVSVGLGLGTYDIATATCTLSFGDNRTLNVALQASTRIPGEVCVGVVDVGNLTESFDYEVTVIHT
jgi:hypothetical protein